MPLTGGAGIRRAKWKRVFREEGLAFPQAKRKTRMWCVRVSTCYSALLEMQEDEIREAGRQATTLGPSCMQCDTNFPSD